MLSKRRSLEQLRALGDKLGPVGSVDIQQRASNELYTSLLRHFGSLDAARAAAAVDAPVPHNLKWTRERVIAELQRLHRRGVRLTDAGLIKAGARGLANAVRTFCGSLPRARRLARVPDPAPSIIERRVWDEATVVGEILELHRAGKSVAASKVPGKLVHAAVYRFGSWEAAIVEAGLDYERVRLVRAPYARDELLAMLRALAKEQPHATLADLWDHRANEAWIREFGSIEAAARAAGLDGWPLRKLGPLLARKQVMSALRARYREGRSLHGADVMRDDAALYKSAVRAFGTWRAAVTGVLPKKARTQLKPHWTKTKVIEALRARKRAGKSMNPGALRRDDSALYHAAKKRLGYNAEVASRDWGAPALQTHWTKATVLRALREAHRRGERARPGVKLAAQTLFGSVIAAREAARLPLLRTVWTDQRVIDEIRALGGRKGSGTLVSIAQRRFGSWRAALEAAGVPAQVRPRWTPEDIAAALREHVQRGHALDSTTVRRQNQSLYDAIRNRWGARRVVPLLARFAETETLPPLQRG